jgi:hypothetical protein
LTITATGTRECSGQRFRFAPDASAIYATETCPTPLQQARPLIVRDMTTLRGGVLGGLAEPELVARMRPLRPAMESARVVIARLSDDLYRAVDLRGNDPRLD